MSNTANAGGFVQQQEQQQLQQHNSAPTNYSHPSGNPASSTSQNWPLQNGGTGTYEDYSKKK